MQVQQFILGMVFKSFLLNPAVPRIIYLVRLNVEKLTQLDQYPIFNFLQGYNREAFVQDSLYDTILRLCCQILDQVRTVWMG